MGKDQSKRIKELEDQVEMLKSTSNKYVSTIPKEEIRGIQKELSKEEQMKLQREVQQLDMMLRGYQEDNEKHISK